MYHYCLHLKKSCVKVKGLPKNEAHMYIKSKAIKTVLVNSWKYFCRIFLTEHLTLVILWWPFLTSFRPSDVTWGFYHYILSFKMHSIADVWVHSPDWSGNKIMPCVCDVLDTFMLIFSHHVTWLPKFYKLKSNYCRGQCLIIFHQKYISFLRVFSLGENIIF